MSDPKHVPEPAPTEPGHVPVLASEVVALLDPRPGQVYADATAGLGGHAASIAPILGSDGLIALNDLDPGNLDRARARVIEACERAGASPPRIETVHGNFAHLPDRLAALGVRADMVLADLGFASTQVDDPSRGFSFSRDGPLDMRLDPGAPTRASDLVGTLDERSLADLIYELGQERHSRRIARKIVEARRVKPIESAGQLASIVRAACPPPRRGSGPRRGHRIDPATRTFQALRIAVNDEIGSLTALLTAIARAADGLASGERPAPWLAPGARAAIIAFHSLEDRPVKQTFLELAQRELATRLTRKPVRASDSEVASNPRSRSAKLRAIRLWRAESDLGAPVPGPIG